MSPYFDSEYILLRCGAIVQGYFDTCHSLKATLTRIKYVATRIYKTTGNLESLLEAGVSPEYVQHLTNYTPSEVLGKNTHITPSCRSLLEFSPSIRKYGKHQIVPAYTLLKELCEHYNYLLNSRVPLFKYRSVEYIKTLHFGHKIPQETIINWCSNRGDKYWRGDRDKYYEDSVELVQTAVNQLS